MASGIELEIAQCIVDASYAIDIVFNCSIKSISAQIGETTGFDTLDHWPLLKHIGLFNLQDTPDIRANVLIGMRDQFEAVGLHWNDVTADHIVANSELLQAKMLEVYHQIPTETFAELKPSAHHMEAAQATIKMHGITEENYSSLLIREYIEAFSDFEKLLATMNYVYGDFSKSLISEAEQVIERATSQ